MVTSATDDAWRDLRKYGCVGGVATVFGQVIGP
jgi:hypothetical protein